MKVIAFNGSPRKDGNTSALLKTILKEIENEGIKSEILSLRRSNR
jgi:multimeric flavodoxin WrbA